MALRPGASGNPDCPLGTQCVMPAGGRGGGTSDRDRGHCVLGCEGVGASCVLVSPNPVGRGHVAPGADVVGSHAGGRARRPQKRRRPRAADPQPPAPGARPSPRGRRTRARWGDDSSVGRHLRGTRTRPAEAPCELRAACAGHLAKGQGRAAGQTNAGETAGQPRAGAWQ